MQYLTVQKTQLHLMAIAVIALTSVQAFANTIGFEADQGYTVGQQLPSPWYERDTQGTTYPGDDLFDPAAGQIIDTDAYSGNQALAFDDRYSSAQLDLEIADGQVVTVSMMVRPSSLEGADIGLRQVNATSISSEASIRFRQNPVYFEGSSNPRWASYLEMHSQEGWGTNWRTIIKDSEDPIWSTKSDVAFGADDWYHAAFTIDTVNDQLIAFASGPMLPEQGVTQIMQLRSGPKFISLTGTFQYTGNTQVLFDDLTISGLPTGVPGDFNGDGDVTLSDIEPFKLALSDFPAWQAAYPDVAWPGVDPNGDESVTLSDIPDFKALLAGTAAVPEPATLTLLTLASLALTRRRR